MLDGVITAEARRDLDAGPSLPISQEIHEMKYRNPGELFPDAMWRIADCLGDGEVHTEAFYETILDMRFLPAGRIQSAMGRGLHVTPYNCFVSGTIPDSFDGIMEKVVEAGKTMRLGGGIGYDFSTLRPNKDIIKSLGSHSCGPLGFMPVYDALCKAIASAGHRRGAQMGMLRVNHPDIEAFIEAKSNSHFLNAFNLSVAVTDEFMNAVINNDMFDLRFEGKVYKTICARTLWHKIMRMTWDWAEPGVIFIDTINRLNNLWYGEAIAATNPCAEQPLPPYGACLLGSFNLTKYVYQGANGSWSFAYDLFIEDIPIVVRAMDNVVDRAIYPLEQQEAEAKSKRRMGLGITGLANTIEALGYEYGSEEALKWTSEICEILANHCYMASSDLAAEKGEFPLFEHSKYMASEFIQRLWPEVQQKISVQGIRNSHLTSIAPTGTISLSADNISSGVEPVFSYGYEREIQTSDGPRKELVDDYGVRVFGVRGKTANQCSVDDHLNMMLTATFWMDSSVSKTCNVGEQVTFEEFEEIYMKAWIGGAKGCTTFRAAGKRYGILNEVTEAQAEACFIDPETGNKTCE